jgi:hypothetical protein
LFTTWVVLCKSHTTHLYDNIDELCAWFTQYNSSCKQVVFDSLGQVVWCKSVLQSELKKETNLYITLIIVATHSFQYNTPLIFYHPRKNSLPPAKTTKFSTSIYFNILAVIIWKQSQEFLTIFSAVFCVVQLPCGVLLKFASHETNY